MKILAQQHWSDSVHLQQQGNVHAMTVIQVALSSYVDHTAQGHATSCFHGCNIADVFLLGVWEKLRLLKQRISHVTYVSIKLKPLHMTSSANPEAHSLLALPFALSGGTWSHIALQYIVLHNILYH